MSPYLPIIVQIRDTIILIIMAERYLIRRHRRMVWIQVPSLLILTPSC